MASQGSEASEASGDPEQEHADGGRRRPGAAGAAGAAAAAGGAIAGAQALLGLDVADAATGEDGAVDSVVPLGDAPVPADAFDRSGDVDAFLDEDATVALDDPGADPLDDDLTDVGDPVGAAFAAVEDPAAGIGGPEDVDHEQLEPFDESGPGEDPDDGGDDVDVFEL